MAADTPGDFNARITVPHQTVSAIVMVGGEPQTVQLAIRQQVVSARLEVGGAGIENVKPPNPVSARVLLGRPVLSAELRLPGS